jgi:lipoprotein LprG
VGGPGARRSRIGVLAAGSLLAAACGHSAAAPPARAVTTALLLQRSRAVVDAAPAVHFTLSGKNVEGSSIDLTGGSGDLVRPDELTGSFTISDAGFNVSVSVVEAGGHFYALPPFASHYRVTNPATYGLKDPAQLLNPSTGVSALLTSMTDVHTEGQQRISGELVDVIGGTVPGAQVPVLPDLDRADPVALTASIDPQSDQLRRVALAGPFTKAGATTVYTVTLTDYGEHVHVTAPAT